jgi:oligopeptide/dipeptide ABC transporter ATP-binding protein
MEAGPAASVYADPLHPYTRALLAAEPVIDPGQQRARREARHTLLKRDTTDEAALEGCPFAPRCPEAAAVCSTTRPREDDVDGRRVACHLYDPQSGHPGAVSISRGVRPSDSARGAHHAQAQGTITAKTHEMLGDSESLGNAFVWRGDR